MYIIGRVLHNRIAHSVGEVLGETLKLGHTSVGHLKGVRARKLLDTDKGSLLVVELGD